jgi:hypothetical protein
LFSITSISQQKEKESSVTITKMSFHQLKI